jgi:hypothetical protein
MQNASSHPEIEGNGNPAKYSASPVSKVVMQAHTQK